MASENQQAHQGFTEVEFQEIGKLASEFCRLGYQSNLKPGAITMALGMAAKMIAQDTIFRAKKPMPVTEDQVIAMAKNHLGMGFDQNMMPNPDLSASDAAIPKKAH